MGFSKRSFLKHTMKPPIQKKIEKIFLYSAVSVGIFLIAGFFLQGVFIKDTVSGLKGEFYKGENFEQKISVNISKTINFAGDFDFNNKLPKEHFSVRWSGFVKAPKSNQYTFYINLNGGARLFIDGNLLINERQIQAEKFIKGFF